MKRQDKELGRRIRNLEKVHSNDTLPGTKTGNKKLIGS